MNSRIFQYVSEGWKLRVNTVLAEGEGNSQCFIDHIQVPLNHQPPEHWISNQLTLSMTCCVTNVDPLWST